MAQHSILATRKSHYGVVCDARRAYALRVPRQQMGSLPEMLRAVPPATVAAMQAALRRVWPRFAYLGVIDAERRRRAGSALGGGAGQFGRHAGRDAVATLITVLDARTRLREARSGPARRGAEDTAAAPGCVADPLFGGDTSPELPESAAAGFEGVTVNGWVI